MNVATPFDVGPLNWVKNEIDLALARADGALQQYIGSGELTQLKFCRTHLHQVQGALSIVGLDGVTQFAEALESLLETFEQRRADAAAIALAQRALASIGHYLDDLVSGQPNQPLRLLSIYREVQTARGVEHVAASDLFFPDLSVRPPRRQGAAKTMSASQLAAFLRHERSRFQRGLLGWLRAPRQSDGVNEMLTAVSRIEKTQETASARSFWWAASGLLSALAEGTLPPDAGAKQLCARIDLQIRRLLEGSGNVAERLLRDVLYLVASADSQSAAVQEVKDAYQLATLLPLHETTAPAPEEAVLRRLREAIGATEEAWNRYCAGTQQSLALFVENANALSAAVDQLGHTDFRRLAQAIAAAARWLAEDSRRHADALAMEIATAILLAQNAQESFRQLGGDFAHQVDVTVARIHGCLAGSPPLPGSEIPLLDEMSRQAQEKLLVGQVAKEIQNNLAQIEQVLDGFFRDESRRVDLAALDVAFAQVAGALSMMRHDDAAAAVRQCAEEIACFSEADYVAQGDDFERVANQLSLIGFFIDTLPHGDHDFASFVRQMQPGALSDVDAGEAIDVEAPGVTVEQEVARQKRENPCLARRAQGAARRSGFARGNQEQSVGAQKGRRSGRRSRARRADQSDAVDAGCGRRRCAANRPGDGGAQACRERRNIGANQTAGAGQQRRNRRRIARYLHRGSARGADDHRRHLARALGAAARWPIVDHHPARRSYAQGQRADGRAQGSGRDGVGRRADAQPVVAPGTRSRRAAARSADAGAHALRAPGSGSWRRSRGKLPMRNR